MAGKFETLWYEDDEGNYLGTGRFETFPENATVQVSRFPFELTTTYLSIKDNKSSLIAKATSTYSSELLFAMTRPSFKEMIKQILRYGSLGRKVTPKMGVFLAAASCERCMNSLAHRYGLDWGYKEKSDDWKSCRTSCERCLEGE